MCIRDLYRHLKEKMEEKERKDKGEEVESDVINEDIDITKDKMLPNDKRRRNDDSVTE